MKLYNKPELNIEKFDIEDVLTANDGSTIGNNTQTGAGDFDMGQSAGMEFDITAEGNEF